jgi:hypothetical protein
MNIRGYARLLVGMALNSLSGDPDQKEKQDGQTSGTQIENI